MNESRSGSSGRPSGPEPCGVCGGDGRLENAWGQVAKCPSCHGSGRRREEMGFHDVTKTKPSHHGPQRSSNGVAAPPPKPVWPITPAGDMLAKEIRDSAGLSAETKARLTREIMDHEATHGQCTKTFLKKVRKQFRPQA